MAIECLKGGELYFNMTKVGKYPGFVAHYFFCQVVDAIAHMHSRGYCHRDLKPWNIMMTEDLDGVKVIDFSYSTPLNNDENCPEMLRKFLSGTKQYMSPEQNEMERFPIMDDFSKIDVWALGVLLINMLTLDFAFAIDGKNVIEDRNAYQAFMDAPRDFFEKKGVKLPDEEMANICNLL